MDATSIKTGRFNPKPDIPRLRLEIGCRAGIGGRFTLEGHEGRLSDQVADAWQTTVGGVETPLSRQASHRTGRRGRQEAGGEGHQVSSTPTERGRKKHYVGGTDEVDGWTDSLYNNTGSAVHLDPTDRFDGKRQKLATPACPTIRHPPCGRPYECDRFVDGYTARKCATIPEAT